MCMPVRQCAPLCRTCCLLRSTMAVLRVAGLCLCLCVGSPCIRGGVAGLCFASVLVAAWRLICCNSPLICLCLLPPAPCSGLCERLCSRLCADRDATDACARRAFEDVFDTASNIGTATSSPYSVNAAATNLCAAATMVARAAFLHAMADAGASTAGISANCSFVAQLMYCLTVSYDCPYFQQVSPASKRALRQCGRVVVWGNVF